MTKYRKKPVVIDATQWFKNRDHPHDGHDTFKGSDGFIHRREGKVVRYFRRPDAPGERPCAICGELTNAHGWIDTLEGGHVVCPGDWIITGVQGEHYPCKPDIFVETYERVE